MTAVASPPTLSQHTRPAWGVSGHRGVQSIDAMNSEELNRMFMPRKSLQRNNSSSSISSTSSTSSASTVVNPGAQQPHTNGNTNGAPLSIAGAGDLGSWVNPAPRKQIRQGKGPWPPSKPDAQSDFARMAAGRPQLMGMNGSGPMQPSPILQSQPQMATQQGMARPLTEPLPQGGQPVLYLLSLNGTFERKTISVPFSPDTLRIGRQTNAKTVPTPTNGFFDSKVLSRQHAEIWADRQGKIWIRDVKSSNGTFVNGTRLSQENRESEPHELQTGDHLELGIDIVSDDQKTVVHHKVAAKVEHAGFLNTSSNLLDMNFGDLDPSNAMMMQHSGGMPFRGRTGSQASVASNGRIMPGSGMMGAQSNGVPQQRAGFFFSPISTEQIVKKLQNEMRTARLQSQDLGRTGHFISALLSKDDIKDMEKLEASEAPKSQMANGNGGPFMRVDNKARFSDPPAPPPQQPLPEKPDVPSLKRGITERPKTNVSSANVSPIRQDGNVSQILQLTEALNSAKKELETQTSRMRDLEEKLNKERQARELAEELARRLEETAATTQMNGAAVQPERGSEEPTLVLDQAFEPPTDSPTSPEADTPTNDNTEALPPAPQVETIEASASQLHNQLESMVLEMKDLRQQLEVYKARAETAETERDADRQTLAEMAMQIRKDAESRETAAREKSRSRSRSRSHETPDASSVASEDSTAMIRTPSTESGASAGQSTPAGPNDAPTLSRANTITPYTSQAGQLAHNQALANSMPYASMIGVVLLGMGLMAYINGWQPQPPRLER
ncbi:putative FHA domain-containing protein [Seiridium cardinale]|uniref:FHA domain-containing protein n=1 Tax=Seiridium cardinale TaxID=138064 RepID=A0ABR2Y588_9PEZI